MAVLVLTGPTAAGKTECALEVAEKFDATVLSADAMQVYRGMDIGTAKVSKEDQARVAHEGIDVVDPDQHFDAATFVNIGDKLRRQKRPIVIAGGTAMYIRAFIRGLVSTPPVDPALRAEMEQLSNAHELLKEVDPELASRLHPNDRKRIVRGLEVYKQTGERLSALQAEHAAAPDRVHVVGLWLDRPDLYERIDLRVQLMMQQGYLGEVERLLDEGYAPTLKPMNSFGYRHLCEHLIDALPLEEALRRTARDTRQFARKQRNWMQVLGFQHTIEGHREQAMRAADVAFR